jgi:hypothetical protein
MAIVRASGARTTGARAAIDFAAGAVVFLELAMGGLILVKEKTPIVGVQPLFAMRFGGNPQSKRFRATNGRPFDARAAPRRRDFCGLISRCARFKIPRQAPRTKIIPIML